MSDVVRAFRALGDPSRQKILSLLEGAHEMCVSELARHFTASLSTLSYHLQILRDASLVTARKHGKEVHYAVDAGGLAGCCRAFCSRFDCFRPILSGRNRAT